MIIINVHYVEDIACLNDKVDMILSRLAAKHVRIDAKDVIVAQLVEQKEQIYPWRFYRPLSIFSSPGGDLLHRLQS